MKEHFSNLIRFSGQEALLSNIEACISLAQELKTTLGPCGMDKIIQKDNFLISNDGATLAQHFELDHPAALLLVETSKTQDQNVGDGTTSVILLTAELLRGAKSLLAMGVHPAVIIQGYRKACLFAKEVIENVAVDVKESHLVEIAKTCLSSKILGIHAEYFAKLAVNAVLKLKKFDDWMNRLYVVKKIGKNMLQSELVDGILLLKNGFGPKRVENAKILVCKMENLGHFKTKIYGTRIRVETHEQGHKLSSFEQQEIQSLCKKIVDLGVNVVFNGHPIFDTAKHYFTSHGVLCVGNLDFKQIDMLSLATGCPIVTNLEYVKGNLGKAGLVEQVCIADEMAVKVTGCDWCSVLLRAPTKTMLSECERSFHDAIRILHSTINCKKVVGGGGALYIEIAKRLREQEFSNKIQLVVEVFSNALETIPTILSQNGGFDSAKLVTELRNVHKKKEGIWYGIDMENGTVSDMLNNGIIEPAALLSSILTCACDSAEMILRIDENVYIKPLPTPEELGLH